MNINKSKYMYIFAFITFELYINIIITYIFK